MAAKKSVKKAARTVRSTIKTKPAEVFTAEERAAMREHVRAVS